jgi:SpoVK/Ycf46/Vps4 family AAA+-type ATPase
MRGAPEDIDPAVLRDAIMSVTPEDLADRTAQVLGEVGQIKIHIDGKFGLRNIANAWKRMLYLKRRFSADIVEEIVVAVLLASVTPKQVRNAISNLQKGGNTDEQNSYRS